MHGVWSAFSSALFGSRGGVGVIKSVKCAATATLTTTTVVVTTPTAAMKIIRAAHSTAARAARARDEQDCAVRSRRGHLAETQPALGGARTKLAPAAGDAVRRSGDTRALRNVPHASDARTRRRARPKTGGGGVEPFLRHVITGVGTTGPPPRAPSRRRYAARLVVPGGARTWRTRRERRAVVRAARRVVRATPRRTAFRRVAAR